MCVIGTKAIVTVAMIIYYGTSCQTKICSAGCTTSAVVGISITFLLCHFLAIQRNSDKYFKMLLDEYIVGRYCQVLVLSISIGILP